MCSKLLMGLMLAATSCVADEPGLREWKWSMMGLGVAHGVDYMSSLGAKGVGVGGNGVVELNPLVRGREGQFLRGRGAVLKCVVVGGVWFVERRLIRGDGRMARRLTKVNWVVGGMVGGVGVRNIAYAYPH